MVVILKPWPHRTAGHTYKEHASLHLPGSPLCDLGRTTVISEHRWHLDMFDFACLWCVRTLLSDRPAWTCSRASAAAYPLVSMNNPRGGPGLRWDLILAVLTACPLLPWPPTQQECINHMAPVQLMQLPPAYCSLWHREYDKGSCPVNII